MRIASAATVLAVLLVAAGVANAVTLDLGSVTVDENGNGAIGTSPIRGELITDPTSSSGSKVLAYPLPFAVTPGDVVLSEPGTPENSNSDLIRFVTVPQTFALTDGIASAASLLLFYSDLASPVETADLADVGVPPASPNAVTLAETGLFGQSYSEGGPNGALYTPTAGQPGSFGVTYVGNVSSPTYTFISDGSAVPLPPVAWAGLVLMGGVAAAKAIRRCGNLMA